MCFPKSTRQGGRTSWTSTQSQSLRVKMRYVLVAYCRLNVLVIVLSYVGGGILLSGFTGTPGSAQAHSRVLSPQVGLPYYCLGHYQGAYHVLSLFDFLIEPKSAPPNRN